MSLSETAGGPRVGEIIALDTPPGASVAGIGADGRLLIDSRHSTRLARAVVALGWQREAKTSTWRLSPGLSRALPGAISKMTQSV